jgi:superfamily II DNA/RNA helicase
MSTQPRSRSAAPAKGAKKTAAPRKSAKRDARSIERAKRFAATRSQDGTAKTAPAAATKRPNRNAPQRDTRPNVDPRARDERPNFESRKRDERPKSFEPRKKDERPNFEPRKREKFVPGRKPKSAAYGRDERPAPRADKPFHKSPRHQVVQDFGANDTYIANEVIPADAPTKSWSELGLPDELIQVLTGQGIKAPFPIQSATLPDALAGRDILGRGQTGSGKTLAFGLALLTNLKGKQAKPHKPLALILTPTRELAQQIDEVLTPLARAVRHESIVIAGGMSYVKQITAMRKATAILVATPGRLIDLLNRGEVQLDNLEITVLDEADQMADMGFLPVVKEILDQAKPDGQRLLFSATLDRGVDSLVRKYLNDPKTHSLQNDRASVSTMEHYVLVVHPSDKDEVTNQIAARDGKTILFVKTQRGADRLADRLASVGVSVGALHGGKSQAVRTRTLALFKSLPNAALVATDVAARGIHVDGISLVVHVDAPTDHKDYLHRAGRTARAGEEGTVVTLATTKQQKAVGGLTARAGVTPKFVGVRPLADELVSITGSQEPSGVAYVQPVVEVRSFKRSRPNSSQRRQRSR